MGEPGASGAETLDLKMMAEMLRYRGWVATMMGFLPEAGTMLTSKVRVKRKYSRIQFATGRGGEPGNTSLRRYQQGEIQRT